MARYDLDWNQAGRNAFANPRGWRNPYGEDYYGDYGRQRRYRYGGDYSGNWSASPGLYGGAYGGLRSDAQPLGRGSYDRFQRGRSEFGPGGGAYDVNYTSGRYARGYDRSYGGYGVGGPGVAGDRGSMGDADRIRAADIMTEDPEAVTPDTSVADAAKKMRDLNVGIIPVVEDTDSRRLRGVVTDRDLAIRVLAEGKDGKVKVGDCLTPRVETVNRNDPVHRILDVMKREQVRRVPVTDREGRLVGIVAQADLAVNYAGLNLQRETEVEETIERISEPAEPRRTAPMR